MDKFEVVTKRPSILKGIERDLHWKNNNGVYTSVDVYRVGNDGYMLFRTPNNSPISSVWVVLPSIVGLHVREVEKLFYEYFGDYTDTLNFISENDIINVEFVELFDIDVGLKETILHEPGYTMMGVKDE